MEAALPQAIRLEDYTPPVFFIDKTELRFEIASGRTEVTAELSMRRNPDGGGGELVLAGEQMELLSVAVDGKTLGADDYSLDDETLTLPGVPDAFVLRTVVAIVPEDNSALEGLYKSGNMYCTQCEAQGFRKITYYLDRPDVMSKFRTTIVGDGSALPVMLSNGNEVARETLDDGRTLVTWEDPFPKPAYLFALVAGDLEHRDDSFVTASGREVKLRIFSEPHNIGQVDYAMDALKRSMKWDEEVYGREYDLDIFMIVAVDDFNMGAMENKGLNVFNTSCVLATPETTTDMGFLRVEAVVGHEYFHNWSGNRVTCRDWFQLSLKEGFTVFRDAEFSADENSPTVKRIEDVDALRNRQFAEDAGPMAHPVRPDSYIEISNFYTVTVYRKGAEVVRMIHTLLGAERFRKGSDLYFDRHDGQAVTCDDFVNAMQEASGVDLSQFRLWYSQAGTPELDVKEHYDSASKTFTLRIGQSCPPTPRQPEKKPFHIPVAVGFLDAQGREMLGERGKKNGHSIEVSGAENPQGDGTLVLHLREAAQEFVFSGVEEKPVLSFLRGFSAPVREKRECSKDDLAFLMKHDTDGFARWNASQTLYSIALNTLIDDPSAEIDPTLSDAIAALIESAHGAADDGEEKAVLAAMLKPPSEDYLGQGMKVVRVDEIHAARERVRQHVADTFSADLEKLYKANQSDAAYSPDSVNIARRSLKNTALRYLSIAKEGPGIELANAQYQGTDNMTDRLSALCSVIWSDRSSEEQRGALLGDFFQRFENEALVVDQWFAVQAMSTREGAVARMRELCKHKAFNPRNPNKVRALIWSFCGQNPSGFHVADGSGYEFLADWIIELNTKNPQVAARLVSPLIMWRAYDEARQDKMKAALGRIAAESNLSKDVFEIVSKALDA